MDLHYEEGDDIVYANCVDQRIAALSEKQRADWEDGELKELLALRADVRLFFGRWGSGMSFVKDDYFAQYAEDKAKDIYGSEVVDSGYFKLVAFTDDERERFTEVEFGSTTYWGDGR